MAALIDRSINKLNSEINVSDFKKFLSQTFPPEKAYIGLNFTVQVIRSLKNSLGESFILKVTLKHYLLH